ncbi:MAG: hypothetical protein GEV13_36445 [Rhodospirillales bacterium]|nr:hypothetical protein [Rhodospirillales bacterium]
MADLTYDPNPPRKPRPIASSPFWTGTSDASATPGFSIAPPSDPGFKIPTPMGWLTPDHARRMLSHMAPSREAIADTLGVPMDGAAWLARRLGAKGIPGGYGEADPLTQAFNAVVSPGRASQPMWKPSADVPFSSENIRRLLQQSIPPGGLL